MDDSTLGSLSILQLLAVHARVLGELRTRGVLRTTNNPVADYAELLVCRALSLIPAPNSEKGHDATDADGKRYEIKARRQTKESRPTRFSAIRGLEEGHFDFLVAVLFTEDFRVHRAAMLTREAVAQRAFWQKHVNGWILPLGESLWYDESAQDVTARIRGAQDQE
jgi:hypothetical protein